MRALFDGCLLLALVLALGACDGASTTPSHRTLIVIKSGSGEGRVVSTPEGLDCGDVCSASFQLGSTVVLRAEAAPGSRFAGFTDECDASGPCVVQLDLDVGVGARFEKVDGASPDAGAADVDAGELDAGAPPMDAGTLDAGPPPDAGAADAGPPPPAPEWQYSPGAAGFDYARAVAGGPGGEVFFGGVFGSSGTTVSLNLGGSTFTATKDTGYLARFDASGHHVWSQAVSGSGTSAVMGLAADGSGNLFVTGSFNPDLTIGGTSVSGPGRFVAKLDPTGALEWIDVLPAGSNAMVMAVAANGDLFFATAASGTTSIGGASVTGSGLLCRLDGTTGNALWAKALSASVSTTLDTYRLVQTSGGDLLLAGYLVGTADFGSGNVSTVNGSVDVLLLRYTSSGTLVSARLYGGSSDEVATQIAVDAAQNLYVAGIALTAGTTSFGTINLTHGTGYADVFAMRIDSSGTVSSAKMFKSIPTQSGGLLEAVALWPTPSGALLLGVEASYSSVDADGTIHATSAPREYFEFHLDASTGAPNLSTSVPNVNALGMTEGPFGNRIIAGTHSGADFGVPPGPLASSGSNTDDSFVAVLPP